MSAYYLYENIMILQEEWKVNDFLKLEKLLFDKESIIKEVNLQSAHIDFNIMYLLKKFAHFCSANILLSEKYISIWNQIIVQTELVSKNFIEKIKTKSYLYIIRDTVFLLSLKSCSSTQLQFWSSNFCSTLQVMFSYTHITCFASFGMGFAIAFVMFDTMSIFGLICDMESMRAMLNSYITLSAPMNVAVITSATAVTALTASLATNKIQNSFPILTLSNIDTFRLFLQPKFCAIIIAIPIVTLFCMLFNVLAMISAWFYFSNMNIILGISLIREVFTFNMIRLGIIRSIFSGIWIGIVTNTIGLYIKDESTESFIETIITSFIISSLGCLTLHCILPMIFSL